VLKVIVLGPPASGKGTQAVRLAQSREIPKISTGDILREAAQAGTPLGLKAKALMDRGELVSDDDMVNIVRERLSRPDATRGFILDGFPRTVRQAQTLDTMTEGQPLVIIDLAVPDGELIHRMEERRVCTKCARNAEPGAAAADTCTRCGGKMTMRADDGDVNVRQPILTALFRCFDGDLLPFGLFLQAAVGIELHNRAVGNDRRNFGCTNFDGLLHDQVHVFSFWNCLSQNYPAAQRRCFRFM